MIQYYWSAIIGTDRSIGFAALMRQEGFDRFEEALELSEGLCRSFFRSLSKSGRQTKTERFQEFVAAIREVLSRADDDTEKSATANRGAAPQSQSVTIAGTPVGLPIPGRRSRTRSKRSSLALGPNGILAPVLHRSVSRVDNRTPRPVSSAWPNTTPEAVCKNAKNASLALTYHG